MTFSTVLFDLDGTLTDSSLGIGNSIAYALAAMGHADLPADQLQSFIGPPLQESFASLGFDAEGSDRALAKYREYFAETGIYENRVYDGILDLLRELRSRDITLAVATSKPTVFAEQILAHFGLAGYFAYVSGAELDGTRRHKDEVIAHALSELDLADHDDVTMVGDRAQDVIGAARCGVSCIAVSWGYAADGELPAAGPTAIVSSPAELLGRLTHGEP